MIERDRDEPGDRTPELTDAELDAWAEFTEAQARGEEPKVEEFLARKPGMADRLRPSLEAAVWLHAEFAALRRKYPGIRARHLLRIPARTN